MKPLRFAQKIYSDIFTAYSCHTALRCGIQTLKLLTILPGFPMKSFGNNMIEIISFIT